MEENQKYYSLEEAVDVYDSPELRDILDPVEKLNAMMEKLQTSRSRKMVLDTIANLVGPTEALLKLAGLTKKYDIK